MSVTINGTSGVTFNDASNQTTAATGFGFKNRIINGAMVIDQRNAGASVTITNTSDVTYTLDRWFAFGTVASKFSVEQTITGVSAPVGFTEYLAVTSSSAYPVTSSDSFSLGQSIEGLNVADLGWGTANAQTVTLSFWVRSSLTGTFGGSIRNSAVNRSYPFTYTILSANTWELKSVTIAGDTSGTWLTTNGVGVRVGFGLGQGSTFSGTAGAWASSNLNNATGATSVVGTNGATFYITGVQLEKGSTATSFDYRPYGTELALCQRYFEKVGFGDSNSRYPSLVGYLNATSQNAAVGVSFVVAKRAVPTLVKGSDSVSNCTTAVDGASIQGFRYLITATATGQAGANFLADGVTATSEL
jgi:hypothetical protein